MTALLSIVLESMKPLLDKTVAARCKHSVSLMVIFFHAAYTYGDAAAAAVAHEIVPIKTMPVIIETRLRDMSFPPYQMFSPLISMSIQADSQMGNSTAQPKASSAMLLMSIPIFSVKFPKKLHSAPTNQSQEY
jgi:hypothetical protein